MYRTTPRPLTGQDEVRNSKSVARNFRNMKYEALLSVNRKRHVSPKRWYPKHKSRQATERKKTKKNPPTTAR